MKYWEELAPKKKNKRGRVLSLLRFHYPLIITICLFLAFVQYMSLMNNAKIVGESAFFNPIQIWGGNVIAGIIIPLIIPFIVWRIVKRERPHSYRIISILSDLVALGSIAFVAFTLWIVCVFSIFIVFDDQTHKDKLHIENQIVSLVGHNTYDDLGYGRFALYRCDNWGFSCSEIYETESRYDTSLPAELVYDAEVQQITVKIDGQIVYTHQLE